MDLSANHKGPYFPITNPITGDKFYPPEGRYWVFNEQEVMRRIEDGRIIFGKSGKLKIRLYKDNSSVLLNNCVKLGDFTN